MSNKDIKNNIESLEIFRAFNNSPYLSMKHSSYFKVYDDLFSQYKDSKITFVEVGVLNGGSLFMWRDYFGPNARIIGVDLNPQAKKWEEYDFEVFIGNQGDPLFWEDFFKTIGPVDIVLDDGGHTFVQQIVTVHCSIPNIRNGGIVVVEDTHTSYFEEFGYPTRYSFIEWSKRLIDNLNSRFHLVNASNLSYKDYVYSITFFESIVSYKIDANECYESSEIYNSGISFDAKDFRYHGSWMEEIKSFIIGLIRKYPFLGRIYGLDKINKYVLRLYSIFHTMKATKNLDQ
ncbi:class I SAM-dependent methyltransferase [Candidatus Pseudothioglobus singularis]|nr:class I SAM-dependent methyltransferase [Candidatus Pseudothioglobus singularis]